MPAYILQLNHSKSFLTGKQNTLLGQFFKGQQNSYILGKVNNNIEWIYQFSF